MASSRRHSSSSVALSIPAEGLRHGCPVTVCRNLYASFKGAPLTLMPSLQFPSSPTAAQPAADFFPGVYPALTFRAVDAGELFTTVGSFHSTSGDVAAVQPLSLEENARYSRALLAAYSSLVATAAAGAVSIQPLLARYRLLDNAGRTLFESIPASVALPSGWQLTQAAQAYVTPDADGRGFTVGELRLVARAFTVEADIPELSSCREVAAVEIELSPMLHPVDPAVQAFLRVNRSSSLSPVASVALPGATAGGGDLTPLRTQRVRRLAASPDGVMTVVCRLAPSPFPTTITLLLPATADVDSDLRTVADAVGSVPQGAPSADRRLLRRCSPPHGFEATLVCRSGDTVAYSGVRPRLWGGPHPSELLVGGTAEADATVAFRAGNLLLAVRREVVKIASDGAPQVVPLVGYPDLAATEITISLARGAALFEVVLPLTADAASRSALYVAPGLLPVDLPAVAALTPSGLPSAMDRHDGVLMIAGACAPRLPSAVATVSESAVTAVAAADRGVSAWDSSRCHLYAIASEGILGVTADTAACRCAATMLHPGITANGAVVTPGGIYIAMRRGVALLTSSGVRQILSTAAPVAAIGFDADYGLTTMRFQDGTEAAMDSEGYMYPVDTADPGAFDWSATVNLPEGMRVAALSVDMVATAFTGIVELIGAGPGGNVRLAAMRIDGADITRPVILRSIESPLRQTLSLRITARASTLTLRSTHLIPQPTP